MLLWALGVGEDATDKRSYDVGAACAVVACTAARKFQSGRPSPPYKHQNWRDMVSRGRWYVAAAIDAPWELLENAPPPMPAVAQCRLWLSLHREDDQRRREASATARPRNVDGLRLGAAIPAVR
jgi:hypothetical protein